MNIPLINTLDDRHMLSLRLKQAHAELQSHRFWLHTFVNTRVWRIEVGPSWRSFSNAHHHGQKLTIRREAVGPTEADVARSEAKRRKKERWERRKAGHTKDDAEDEQLQALSVRKDLLEAVSKQSTQDILRLYRELPEKRPLMEQDFRAIAQWTHQAVRLEGWKSPEKRRRADGEELISFTELLMQDVMLGNIVPSLSGHIHILGIFKETRHFDAGKRFWDWLGSQDESHVQSETYAAAIELLAVAGSPLPELEEMYQQALSRFPGDFHAYHLSPDAVVPDRERALPINKLPLSLLQSISYARLLRGDSRNAYLALGTALRLKPTTAGHRFFKIFIDERPLSEAYIVFAIACRAGNQLPLNLFRQLISNLRTRSDPTSIHALTASLRTMLSVIYLQLGASGKLPDNILSELVISMTQLFRLPGVEVLETKQRQKVVDSVLNFIRMATETFARFGTLPTLSAFNSIIVNVVGYGRSEDVLGIVMKDIDALGLQPSHVTRRSILTVAGLMKDRQTIEKTWHDILEARRARGEWPDATDFFVLSKAAKLAGNITFVQRQFDSLKGFLPRETHGSIEYAIVKEDDPAIHISKDPISFDHFMSQLQTLGADLDVIEQRTRSTSEIQDFGAQSLPTTLLPPTGALILPEADMRKIYDEMTTEAATHGTPTAQSESIEGPAVVKAEADHSNTNISFGALRYENWKSINCLLQLAEKHDTVYDMIVDNAIATGTRPPPRQMGFAKDEMMRVASIGLSEANATNVRSVETDNEMTIQEAEAEILRLRGN